MSGEDLYFVKWPVVGVKLVIIGSSWQGMNNIWSEHCYLGRLVIRGPRYESHLTSFWKYLAVQISLKIFNLKGPVTECQCVFFLQFINTMENIIVYSRWHFSSSDTFCVFSVIYRAMDERQRHRWRGHRWRMEDMCKDHRWRWDERHRRKSWFQDIWHWHLNGK